MDVIFIDADVKQLTCSDIVNVIVGCAEICLL